MVISLGPDARLEIALDSTLEAPLYRQLFERVRALLLLVSPCLGAAPVAVHASDAEGARRPSFSWSGLHRARYARLWNQHRPGLAGDDQALELRTALRASYEFGRITLVGDLQDARAYLTDEQSGVSTAIVNTVELVQGYVAIGKIDDERGTRVQAGQFLLELGSGRLIADIVSGKPTDIRHDDLGVQRYR